jgi:hypothetical protein
LLDELHDGGPGEELGDGAGAEEGAGRVHGEAGLQVGVAIALGQENFAVADDDDDSAGNVAVVELGGEEAVEEDFELGRVGGAEGGKNRGA